MKTHNAWEKVICGLIISFFPVGCGMADNDLVEPTHFDLDTQDGKTDSLFHTQGLKWEKTVRAPIPDCCSSPLLDRIEIGNEERRISGLAITVEIVHPSPVDLVLQVRKDGGPWTDILRRDPSLHFWVWPMENDRGVLSFFKLAYKFYGGQPIAGTWELRIVDEQKGSTPRYDSDQLLVSWGVVGILTETGERRIERLSYVSEPEKDPAQNNGKITEIKYGCRDEDPGCATETSFVINVPDSGTMHEARVFFWVEHQNVGDLSAEISHAGITIPLLEKGAELLLPVVSSKPDPSNLVPDDDYLTVTFKLPELEHENSQGEWKLVFVDHALWATGRVRSWMVYFDFDSGP